MSERRRKVLSAYLWSLIPAFSHGRGVCGGCKAFVKQFKGHYASEGLCLDNAWGPAFDGQVVLQL